MTKHHLSPKRARTELKAQTRVEAQEPSLPLFPVAVALVVSVLLIALL